MAAGTVFQMVYYVVALGLFQNRGREVLRATDCRRLYDAGRIRLFGVDLASGY